MTLLRGVAAEAAENAYTGWRAHPAGAALLDPALAHAAADLPERAERMVRDWQRAVLELVRVEGGDKRFVARIAAYAVNATGLAVMIAVFASTAFIPTGLEVAAGAGTTVAAQDVLEAIFGDQAVRTLAAKARADLLDRVRALLDAEADRFLAAPRDARPAADAGDGLRRAAGRVERGPAPQRPVRRRPARTARRVPGEQHRRPAARGVPRRPAGRRRRADRPPGRGAPLPRRAVDGHAAGRRAGAPRTPWSSGPAPGWRCPGTTPWSRWPARPAAASRACSTRWPGWSSRRSGSAGRPPASRTPACGGRWTAADRLLDWLGVLPRHRFVRESALDGDDERPCTGWSCSTCPTSTRCSGPTGSRWTGCSAWSTWWSGCSTRRSTPTG